MADIYNRIRDIRELRTGIEYEGRSRAHGQFPLIRGTFKKLVKDDGYDFAVFDPMYVGTTEYNLKPNTEHPPEDLAIMNGLYDYFPLRIEATKKFERNLKEQPRYREKREAVRGLRGSELPPDVTDKISEMLTGIRRKPVKKKTTGGLTRRRRVSKKRRTNKKNGGK